MCSINRLIAGLLGLLVLLPSLAFAGSAGGTAALGQYGDRPYKQTFTASGSFTTKSDIIYLTGCGAGGGGAGGHTADPGGGGGGGSGAQCIIRMPVYLSVGTALTITIGTAGVGGAAGASGGVVNVDTTIAGLPIGTYTILGGRVQTGFVSATVIAPGPGTVTNGGAGGGGGTTAGGATATGAGAICGTYTTKPAGGDLASSYTGAGGGGATGPGAGGLCVAASGYNALVTTAAAAASGTKGGGGQGGHSAFGLGGLGGSNAAGGNCGGGYGAGGGGGAPTFAGGNGCPGFLIVEWSE